MERKQMRLNSIRYGFVAALLVSMATTSVAQAADAPAPTDDSKVIVLRIGTVAPESSSWGKVFNAWKKAVAAKTNGMVDLKIDYDSKQGDEVAMVGKIRSGQLQGAAITGNGLSTISKQVLMLQLPGLFPSWAALDVARERIRPRLDQEFDKAGFKVLGWGDIGEAKLMTKGFKVMKPADLQHKKTFVLQGDAVAPMLFQLIGDTTPKPLTVFEVLPALQSNSINVINVPALVAEQLQWAPKLDMINTDTSGFAIGALVFSATKFKQLPANIQKILEETGAASGVALTKRIREEDAAAFSRLSKRMTVYSPTDADKALWTAIFEKTRKSLVGSTFNADLYNAMMAK